MVFGASRPEELRQRLRSQGIGIPIVAQSVTNPTVIHEDVGSIPDLTRWVKDSALPPATAQFTGAAQIRGSCGCGIDRQLQLRFDP